MNRFLKRLGLLLAMFMGAVPWMLVGIGGEKLTTKPVYFHGKVVPHKDAGPGALAFLTEDGKTYLLKKDPGSAMFYTDEKLRHRPMRLTGQVLPAGTLQVVNVHSVLKGKLHDVYYWCDICAIKRFQSGDCDCCGDRLEFREVPLKE